MWFLKVPVLFFLVSIFISSVGHADAVSVVFGSFQNRDAAETQRIHIQKLVSVTLDIVQVEIEGNEYHRLVSPSFSSSEAEILASDARSRGLSVWYLRDVQPVAQDSSENISAETTRNYAVPSLRQVNRPTRSPSVDPRVQIKAAVADGRSTPAKPEALQLKTADGRVPIAVSYMPDAEIAVDGVIDEAEWKQLAVYDQMLVSNPDTLETPKYGTETRFLYTDDGFYVSAVMVQPADTIVARLSSRDQRVNRDGYMIALDTSGDGLYGYWFEVNLGGSVRDGKMAPERSLTNQWDGPWIGRSAQTDNGWSVEFFLPWSMMSLPDRSGVREMGIWASRKVAHMDEQYAWPALPFSQGRFMSALQPLQFPVLETKRQLAVFPYVSGTHDEIAGDQDFKGGVDLAWRPTTNIQLTATLNPDFGAVESDDVVVNLTAFETFFPEKRLFFLEGNENFITTPRSDVTRFGSSRGGGARSTPSSFTPEPTTLVNTRRIGGAPRHLSVPDDVDVESVELSKPTDLLGAVKATGSAGAFRYGVLAAFEDEVEIVGTNSETGERVMVREDGRDFAVIRGLYETTGSGRRSVGYMGTMVQLPGTDAITHGIDGHFLSSGGRFSVDSQILASDVDGMGYGMFHDFRFNQGNGITHNGSIDYIDDNLDINDFGFISRGDVIEAQYGVFRNKSRGLKRFRQVSNSFFIGGQSNTDGFVVRNGIFSSHRFTFKNNSRLGFRGNYFGRRWDDRNSRGNGMFKVDGRFFLNVSYGTDTSKNFAWSAALNAQQEDLNGSWSPGPDIGFTWSPNDRLSLDLDFQYKDRNGWLLYRGGSNLAQYDAEDFKIQLANDFFITARQQLRFTMQWAGIKAKATNYWRVPVSEGELISRETEPEPGEEDFTLSRLTAQLRYRWELGPLSDLFVVYTRGSRLTDNDLDTGFDDLWLDALEKPVADILVVKLRYRFGF